jgi:hypothetical protein
MSTAQGVDRRVVLHAHERLAFVGELEVLRPPAERGRIDLVLEANDELVPGLHRTVDEGAPFVSMPPFHGLRLERVHREPLEPARIEDERGLRERPASSDANRHLIDEPAAHRAGRLEGDVGRASRDSRGAGLLPKRLANPAALIAASTRRTPRRIQGSRLRGAGRHWPDGRGSPEASPRGRIRRTRP